MPLAGQPRGDRQRRREGRPRVLGHDEALPQDRRVERDREDQDLRRRRHHPATLGRPPAPRTRPSLVVSDESHLPGLATARKSQRPLSSVSKFMLLEEEMRLERVVFLFVG